MPLVNILSEFHYDVLDMPLMYTDPIDPVLACRPFLSEGGEDFLDSRRDA